MNEDQRKADSHNMLSEIENMPKVDLHRHVDGSVEPELAWEMYKQQKQKESATEIKNQEEMAEFLKIRRGMDFDQILSRFELIVDLMQTKRSIYKVFQNQVYDLQEKNIIYAELRFAPAYHTHGELKLREVIRTAISAIREGRRKAEDPTDVRLVICINRECSRRKGEEIVEAALHFENELEVVGIDLACNEADYPPEIHKNAFLKTLDTELNRTAHAGEFGPQRKKNVQASISKLRVNRIGHGIPIPDHDDLIKTCRKDNITVESCPISNLSCGFITDIKNLKLDVLKEKRVPFCINSDDPVLFDKTLSHVLFETALVYGWTMGDLRELTENALEGAFISETERKALRSRLNT